MYSSHHSHISVLDKEAKETIRVGYINSSQMYVCRYNILVYSRIIFYSHLVLPDRLYIDAYRLIID